ncbi:calcium-transporting ATPase 12, plasma membrane-type-like [Olea europaea var. sylvestris]|uniref:calcium-transporting ATPase 12, plasma membrane-type-like n=1 Tax=Olea europaea var. sylvestris TaxID=158386 RepID=UPI000C1CD2B5|nr:calcium-transporting ATPase 12, plasma membrane-type-like [Olea europaea var. sylvestris]
MALEENNLFDVEAQQLPLLPTHEPESTSRTLQRVILLIRSANLFKLSGENYSTDSSSSDSSVSISLPAYNSVGTADGEDNAGSEIVEAAHVTLEFHEDSLIVNSTPQNEYTSTIELQRIQMGNITEMVKTMNLDELHNYGGVQGVADALNTDLINGLSDNLEAFSKCNTNELSQALTFFHFFKEGCNNYTIFLLSLAAVLSLSFGIEKEGVANGWFDGTILLVAIFVLVVFIAIRSYSQARWYEKKFKKQWFSEGRNGKVKVIRSRGPLVVPSSGLRVGDLVCLMKGYQVPADGIFVDGQALKLDDGSSLTIDNEHPFLFYGSRVINGDARMIATSVGMDTVWGEMIGKEIESPEKRCEFEVLLHKLRTRVDFTALLLSTLILTVMFLRYSLGKRDDESGHRPDPKGEPTHLKTIINVIKGIIIESKGTARVLIASLSVSVVGIMEGIPFVISFAVTRWSRKTLAENASEKDPLACVKVASVTAICTDKFGGLTEHQKEVDKFFVDKEFVGESSMVSPNVLESLCDGIGISLLSSSPRGNDEELVLISWAEDKFGLRRETLRHQCSVVKHNEGNLFQCSEALLLKTTENGQECHLHYKGPPQDILSICSSYYNVEGEIHSIDGEKRRMFEQATDYMLDGQEVIAYAWKRTDASNDMSIEANDLIFVGMVGLRNIDQDCIRNAVSTLRKGGVRTILVSGDCIDVLRTIGNNCGLLTPESDALTGEEFRNLTDGERRQKLDRICIIGNCTLHDKVLLVKCLREKGEVVAMLGQKTNDAPALKEADIGLTMGTWSSEIARDCSEIIIWNGDFTFLVKLINNGRCNNENIRKFIQFQLIITISSSFINFIATIVWGDAPMTAFELFWLNMVVAIPGGLALLSECPKESLMKMPLKSAGQLITKAMWRNIALQASYQTAICLTLHLKGRAILGIGAGPIKSMIYNSLFLCQLFNLFVARELEKKNIFKGLHQNRWFWVACAIFLTCQAAMVAADNVFDISTRLNWMLWASCILIGLISWPLDFAGKWIGSLVFLS